MSTTATFTPAQRLALLDSMLRLRAAGSVPAGEEARAAGMAHALARLGALQPLLQVVRRGPWQLRSAQTGDALAAAAHDVEAIHGAALRLAAGIAADGRPRLLELAVSPAPAALGLADDGADAEEHAAWQPVDPVAFQTQRLLAEGLVSPGELMHLHQRALFEAREAQRSSSMPAAAELQPA